jgi:hypothetical protein
VEPVRPAVADPVRLELVEAVWLDVEAAWLELVEPVWLEVEPAWLELVEPVLLEPVNNALFELAESVLLEPVTVVWLELARLDVFPQRLPMATTMTSEATLAVAPVVPTSSIVVLAASAADATSVGSPAAQASRPHEAAAATHRIAKIESVAACSTALLTFIVSLSSRLRSRCLALHCNQPLAQVARR